MASDPSAQSGQCPFSRVEIEKLDVLQKVLRSKAVEEDANVSADNYLCPDELGAINVKAFQEGNLAMSKGDSHRQRRRLLNQLSPTAHREAETAKAHRG